MRKRRTPQRRRLGTSAAARFLFVTRKLGIELLEDRRLLAVDFGDAPDPYPTTLADDGARHEAIGPTFGSLRDDDLDGQSPAGGDGAEAFGEEGSRE